MRHALVRPFSARTAWQALHCPKCRKRCRDEGPKRRAMPVAWRPASFRNTPNQPTAYDGDFPAMRPRSALCLLGFQKASPSAAKTTLNTRVKRVFNPPEKGCVLLRHDRRESRVICAIRPSRSPFWKPTWPTAQGWADTPSERVSGGAGKGFPAVVSFRLIEKRRPRNVAQQLGFTRVFSASPARNAARQHEDGDSRRRSWAAGGPEPRPRVLETF